MARPTELPRDSIAAIALDASQPWLGSERPRLGASGLLRADSPAAVILGAQPARGGGWLAASLVLASALHSGLGLGALSWAPSATAFHAPPAAPPLRIDHIVDLTLPVPPEPPPEPPPETRPSRHVEPAAPRTAEAPPEPTEPIKPPPAKAGQVVAADETAAQPLDFTGFEISTGSGQRYAGGVTASTGTNTRAVHTANVDRNAAPDRAQGASRARPVGLPARDWRCPWPREADKLSLDEQTVVIRVVVRADGAVASTELVSDPGFGFGPIALDCARGQRFPPATDENGQAITATSPPVRIRFTRE